MASTFTNNGLPALGLVELPFFGITAVVADELAKAAQVKVLGIETTGNENLLIKIAGDVASVEAALSVAETKAAQLGATAIIKCISRPEPELQALIVFSNSENALYGGQDQFLATDHPKSKDPSMNNTPMALGFIETQGLTAVLEATDTMLKAANVTLVGKEKIGAAYVTVIVKGDVAAVKAAVDAGSRAVGNLGKLVASHVIARPHDDLASLLPK